MEIIDAIIFVQSFVWATLLIKQPKKKSRYLGLAFLTISLIYVLLYVRNVLGMYVPGVVILVAAIIAALLLSFFQLKNSPLSSSKVNYIAWGALVFLAIFICVFSLGNETKTRSIWPYTSLFGLASVVFDGFLFIKPLLKKTFTGNFLENPQSRLGFLIILDKVLILLFALLILIFPLNGEDPSETILDSFHLLTALLVFITGFLAVSATLDSEGPKKKLKKYKKENQGFIEKLKQFMQEEKPYLDCELTLEKMAVMLDVGENELTRILNHEMDSSFYKLINDARMDTVLQKLNEPDSRKYTIMASAYESGFNSKSTFYRIFKEYTRMTPKEYLTKSR